jgi:2-polyprenyl-6-methoxyphenol hydroxylase-like FAD-dependent oxidoreductase
VKNKRRRVLVSGASIAGPTVGYWLARYGFEVDIFEKAANLRGGGYAIDIRGSSIGVVERMGLLPEIRAAGMTDRAITLLDAHGEVLLKTDADRVMGSVTGFDVEISRGVLSSMIYAASLEKGCRYFFNDSIAKLEQTGSKVHVTMASGSTAEYDYVIGADGLHSNTRKLAFGEESNFVRSMGYCYAAFSMSNIFGADNENVLLSTVDRLVGFTHYPNHDHVYAMFVIADETIKVAELWNPERRQALLEEHFGSMGWYIPQMLEYIKHADDVFADTVSQTRMPSWAKGRVALTGDSAHAPSFITGQGTSLALATAYVLAGELATHADDPAAAFAAYQREVRPFVEANQNVVAKGGWPSIPSSIEMERQRDEMLRTQGWPEGSSADRQNIYCSLKLKDYDG